MSVNLMGSPRKTLYDKDAWTTPQALFDWCDAQFGAHDFDAFASSANTKCELFATIEDGGNGFFDLSADFLKKLGVQNVWANPPYSNVDEIIPLIRPLLEQGISVTMLTNYIAHTKYFWAHGFGVASEITLLVNGKVKFGHNDSSVVKSAPLLAQMITRFDAQEWLASGGDVQTRVTYKSLTEIV